MLVLTSQPQKNKQFKQNTWHNTQTPRSNIKHSNRTQTMRTRLIQKFPSKTYHRHTNKIPTKTHHPRTMAAHPHTHSKMANDWQNQWMISCTPHHHNNRHHRTPQMHNPSTFLTPLQQQCPSTISQTTIWTLHKTAHKIHKGPSRLRLKRYKKRRQNSSNDRICTPTNPLIKLATKRSRFSHA